jgi:hypothetical protein
MCACVTVKHRQAQAPWCLLLFQDQIIRYNSHFLHKKKREDTEKKSWKKEKTHGPPLFDGL